MKDFETLGSFYLGKQYDLAAHKRTDDLLLYDSKDLTTHAVIIGMTGSGKTGLGVTMIEEALIDHIPVIAVDPKGDLGNLALRFPSLQPGDFSPWVDPQQAATSGLSTDAYAAKQAQSWSEGLAEWGEDGVRIQRLVDSADVTIYTPGSSAGRQISLLRAFSAPPKAVVDDEEAFRERVDATTTGLLALLGMDVDPISSREHILVATLLNHAWREGQDLALGDIITGIQSPPFAQIGVMPLETVFPSKERMALAMRINNLLAAPAFQGWLQGEALDTASLLHDATGKPRCSVLSIAHLGDAERMFFMTLLLADIIAWMRTQPGTGSLRAILYIDELFGYMPPVANPPSKPLLLTLLKQARAFGLGVVLASQNPVDLDYRGLSNAGTWFIGRLQTERDKMRVMEGLEGASTGGSFDRGAMEQTIAALGKRVFLLHNVHESAPVTFETRWTLAYLAGPMTREQIRGLKTKSEPKSEPNGEPNRETARPTARATATTTETPTTAATPTTAETPTSPTTATSARQSSNAAGRTNAAPVLPSEIPQYFINGQGDAETYQPRILAVADVSFNNAKYGLSHDVRVARVATIDDGPIPLDWSNAEELTLDPQLLEQRPASGAQFSELPRAATLPKNYAAWGKAMQRWVGQNVSETLFSSPAMKMVSRPDENEREFRIRLQVAAREARDAQVDKLRGRYASKLATLQDRLRRAEQAAQRETEQAREAGYSTAISIGSTILGAMFGRGKVTAGTISKVGTAARGVGRTMQQRGDITRATETVEAVRAQYQELEAQLQAEVGALGASYDAQHEELEPIRISPRASDIRVQFVALLWMR